MKAFDLAVMVGQLGLGSAAMAGTLSLDRGVISAGGGESLVTGYGLSGTIGQPVAHSASTSAGPLVARAGFWTQVLRWVNAIFGHVDVNPPDPSRFYRAISQP